MMYFIDMTTKRFVNRGTELSAYQFMGEPIAVVNGKATLPKTWSTIQRTILKTIREQDARRYVVVSAGAWAFPYGLMIFP